MAKGWTPPNNGKSNVKTSAPKKAGAGPKQPGPMIQGFLPSPGPRKAKTKPFPTK